MTTLSSLAEAVRDNHFRTSELLKKLPEIKDFEHFTATDLFRSARSLGIGLARDGYWYTAEQNAEVAESIEKMQPTFAADQYMRNRS